MIDGIDARGEDGGGEGGLFCGKPLAGVPGLTGGGCFRRYFRRSDDTGKVSED